MTRERVISEIKSAQEVIAVNAVRPARAIRWLDGHPLGVGAGPGHWAERLGRLLSAG